MGLFSSTRRPEVDPQIAIIREIKYGLPITPRHAQPVSIDQKGFTTFIHNWDREAFPKTADFGVRFNKELKWGGFRIQELANPLLKQSHGPAVGRNFDVYFNRVKVGGLMLQAKGDWRSEDKLSGIRLWLDLEHPHLFEYGHLRSFLALIAHATSDGAEKDLEMKGIEVDRAMTRTLWAAMRGNVDITLEWAQSGPAPWILSDEFKAEAPNED